MITKEQLESMCSQNRRAAEQGNISYTRELCSKIDKIEPILSKFICISSEGAAKDFCDRHNLDQSEEMILNVMIIHIAAMVANAFIGKKEIDELEG